MNSIYEHACRRMEDELKLRSELLDATPDSIFLTDFDGNILYGNKAAHNACMHLY